MLQNKVIFPSLSLSQAGGVLMPNLCSRTTLSACSRLSQTSSYTPGLLKALIDKLLHSQLIDKLHLLEAIIDKLLHSQLARGYLLHS